MQRKATKTTQRARSLKPAAPTPADNLAAGQTAIRALAQIVVNANEGDQPTRLMGTDSAGRKRYPITTGFLDYFPDAIAAGAEISFVGNKKHNPGEPMHHARGKSMDHADCIARHLQERGGFDIVVIDGVEYRMRHSAALLWRAAALLQEELEAEGVCSLPRAAVLP